MKKKCVLLLPIRCIIFLFAFVGTSIVLKTTLQDLSKWWSCFAVVINIVTLGILKVFCNSQKITYRELIHYEKGKTRIISVILMVLIILAVGMGGMYIAGYICYKQFPYMAVMMIQPIPVMFAIASFVLLPITTTLAEDGLYLGIGVNQSNDKWSYIFTASIFYALQHCFIPVIWDSRYIAYRFLSFLPLTILLCLIYHKKRNPVPIMAGHFVINIATVVEILMTSLSPELFTRLQNM